MYVFELHEFLVPVEARRACQIPQDGSYRWFWAAMWVLETEQEQRMLLTAESPLQPQDSTEDLVWWCMTVHLMQGAEAGGFSWVWSKLALPTKALSHKTKRKKEDPVHLTVLASPVHYVIPYTHRTPIHIDTTTIMVKCLLKGEDLCLFILRSYGGDLLVISLTVMV